MTDPHRVDTVEQLRALLGEPNALTPLKVQPMLDEQARRFIGLSPLLLLATADAAGNLDVSPKGDPAGFVHVADDGTLLIPDRKGNKLLFGLQNLLANPRVGIVFLLPGTGETLRVNGTAEITVDPDTLQRLSARGQPALLAIRVRVEQCFFHCARAFLRSQLWNPATWPAPQRISFGTLLAAKLGAEPQVAAQIDQVIADSYREL